MDQDKTELAAGLYVVEELLGVDFKENRILVKWEGYHESEATWEPEENLPAKLVFAFYKGMQRKPTCGEGEEVTRKVGKKSDTAVNEENREVTQDVCNTNKHDPSGESAKKEGADGIGGEGTTGDVVRVEKLIGHHPLIGKPKKYHVLWTNGSETWEPLGGIPPDSIKDYHIGLKANSVTHTKADDITTNTGKRKPVDDASHDVKTDGGRRRVLPRAAKRGQSPDGDRVLSKDTPADAEVNEGRLTRSQGHQDPGDQRVKAAKKRNELKNDGAEKRAVDEVWYDVEKLIGHAPLKGKPKEYHVLWSSGEDTWEPAAFVTPDVIRDYHAGLNGKYVKKLVDNKNGLSEYEKQRQHNLSKIDEILQSLTDDS